LDYNQYGKQLFFNILNAQFNKQALIEKQRMKTQKKQKLCEVQGFKPIS